MTNEATKILQRLNARDNAAFLRHTVTWLEGIADELVGMPETEHFIDMDTFVLDVAATGEVLEQLASLLENSPEQGTSAAREVVAWAVVKNGTVTALDVDIDGAAFNFECDHGGTVVKLSGVMP